MNPESKDPLIGMTLGGCRIQALLGRGGMGTVYRAHHIALDKSVALKVLAGHLEADTEFVERFQREARAAARVEHPNVIQVLNVAEEKAQHFIILQYIDGENLEQLLDRNGRLELQEATQIARAAAAGLEALHAQGIVHRDIKPANILLSKDGWVKITDFGLARNLKATSNLTVSGAFMGTPEFIAPEQVDGPKVDHRADLYSLGVVYYLMLSGEFPFNAATSMEMATQHVTTEPIPVESRVTGIDPRAAAITRRLLMKSPDARFAGAGELRAALEEILEPPPSAARPAPAPAPAARTPAPAPPVPRRAQTQVPVPEIQIKGRRNPLPAPIPEPVDADAVPEISAGPRKRIIQGAPVVPREIAPLPPPPRHSNTRVPDASRYPSNPALKKEAPPPVRRPDVWVPEAKPTESRIAWKHIPPPKLQKSLLRSVLFWGLALAGCAAFFAVGALGIPARGDGLLLSLPRPFYHNDGNLLARYLGGAAGIGAFLLAFWANRKQIRATSHPGPAVMVPLFAALCFYVAGLSAPGEAGTSLVRSAGGGAFHSLLHPSNLLLLASWSLLAGLTFGMAGEEDFDSSIGSIFIMLSIGASMGFAAGGDIPSVVVAFKGAPKLLLFPAGAILVAFLGLFLAFGERARAPRRFGGVAVILIALGVAYIGGLKGRSPGELHAPFSGIFTALGHHGVSMILGATLLSWGFWLLHRMVVTTFSKLR